MSVDISLNKMIIDLCKQYKISKIDDMYSKIAIKINEDFGTKLTQERVRSVSRRFRFVNNLDENFNKVDMSAKYDGEIISTGINTDGSQSSERKIEVKNGEQMTPDFLLSKHGFDPSVFQLVNAKNSKWDMQKKGGTVVELYSSKITVKPREEFYWNKESIDKIFASIKKIKKIDLYKYNTQYEKNGKALVVPIVDLHYFNIARDIINGEEYNSEIAEKYYYSVIADILERVKGKTFEKVYFTIGSDAANFDNKLFTTTRGTPQQSAGFWEEMVIKLTDLLINGIEIFKTVAPVEVIYITSNHDYHTMFGIANCIRKVYSDDDNVEVDYLPLPRKYKVFGKTLMGFAHDIDVKNINDIIQSEAREMLGQTDNTIYFIAHLHHESTLDKYGTDIRRLPTVSKNSQWATEKGYKSQCKNQSFILDSEYGVTDVIYSFV